jgi:hypothetical protein
MQHVALVLAAARMVATDFVRLRIQPQFRMSWAAQRRIMFKTVEAANFAAGLDRASALTATTPCACNERVRDQVDQ